jgi:sarcosine oxidase subunit gamma
MVNTEIARSPLGGAKHGNEATVLLQEVPFTPGFDLRVDPESAGFAAVNSALGLTLGTEVGQVVKNESVSALTLGPDWWYLTSTSGTDTADVAALLAPVQEQHHVSVVDVSAQRTKIEIYGPNAKDVLAHYWEQDLRDSHYGIDRCSQGIIAKAPVILWHCCDNCYLVFVRSSFAAHLWAALVDATVDYVK